MDGWTPRDFGNWAEPNKWKKGLTDYKYTCYEKVTTGICKILKYVLRAL